MYGIAIWPYISVQLVLYLKSGGRLFSCTKLVHAALFGIYEFRAPTRPKVQGRAWLSQASQCAATFLIPELCSVFKTLCLMFCMDSAIDCSIGVVIPLQCSTSLGTYTMSACGVDLQSHLISRLTCSNEVARLRGNLHSYDNNAENKQMTSPNPTWETGGPANVADDMPNLSRVTPTLTANDPC